MYVYVLSSIPKFEAARCKASHGRMRTENTERKLFSVFSVWVFSVAEKRTDWNPKFSFEPDTL